MVCTEKYLELIAEINYKKGRKEALDELINVIKKRLHCDSKSNVYELAIHHCIEVAETLKEQT